MCALVFGAIAVPAAASRAAGASPQCNSRARILAQLAKQYGEAPAGVGLAGNGALVEVLTAADGATWSIVITTPPDRTGVRMSCLVAAGEGWRALEQRAPGPDT